VPAYEDQQPVWAGGARCAAGLAFDWLGTCEEIARFWRARA
jgi:hypothetical protein